MRLHALERTIHRHLSDRRILGIEIGTSGSKDLCIPSSGFMAREVRRVQESNSERKDTLHVGAPVLAFCSVDPQAGTGHVPMREDASPASI